MRLLRQKTCSSDGSGKCIAWRFDDHHYLTNHKIQKWSSIISEKQMNWTKFSNLKNGIKKQDTPSKLRVHSHKAWVPAPKRISEFEAPQNKLESTSNLNQFVNKRPLDSKKTLRSDSASRCKSLCKSKKNRLAQHAEHPNVCSFSFNYFEYL